MKELDGLFERAQRVEVSLRWYYDIGELQFGQFKELAQGQLDLQSAVEDSVQMSHWYGPSYLVPIDLVPRSPEPDKVQSNPGFSQDIP